MTLVIIPLPRRNPGAAYRECRWANTRYKLHSQPKKPRKSRAGRGKDRGLGPLGGAAPPSAGGEMGRKKGGGVVGEVLVPVEWFLSSRSLMHLN